jgi:hypothetical protein
LKDRRQDKGPAAAGVSSARLQEVVPAPRLFAPFFDYPAGMNNGR